MTSPIKNKEDLFQLLASPLYRSKFVLSKASQTCIACGGPANSFRDCLARLEYDNSAICEECQARYFKR